MPVILADAHRGCSEPWSCVCTLQVLREALLAAQKGGGGLRGIRAAEAETLGGIETLEGEIELLKNRRWLCPTHLPLAEAATQKEMALLEAKTYRGCDQERCPYADEWLLNASPTTRKSHDIRDLLRSFAHLSGKITTTSSGVTVRLDAPETPG